VAIDVDDDAVQAARENVALNQAPAGIEIRHLALAADNALAPSRFDVVVANLTGAVLAQFAHELANRLAANGTLLVGGALVEEEAALVHAFAHAGLRGVRRQAEDEWIALEFSSPAQSIPIGPRAH
jgi:ribosomal protein L11 methylase PrmA